LSSPTLWRRSAIRQAVDVVHANPAEHASTRKRLGDREHCLRDLGYFRTYRHQVVDGEEAPHVSFGIPPERELVVLERQCAEQVPRGPGTRWPVRTQRERAVEVPHRVTGGLQTQLSRLHRIRKGPAEARHDHPFVSRLPVDVEEPGLGGDAAAPQHLPPPAVAVRLGRGDVVRHDVHQQPHAMATGRLPKAPQGGLATECIAHGRRIDHVVAVRTAVHRLRHRREVEVADSEVRQRAHGTLGGGEAEVGSQLDAVGGDRRRVGRHDPILAHGSARSGTVFFSPPRDVPIKGR